MLKAFGYTSWDAWRISIGVAMVSTLAMFVAGMMIEHWLKLPTTFLRDYFCPFVAGCAGAMMARQTAYRPALVIAVFLSALTISSLSLVFTDRPLRDRAYIIGCFFLFNTSPLVGAAVVNWFRGPESCAQIT